MSFLYVKVHYGPDNTFHRLKHKPQRFDGIRDRLLKLGFRVTLFKVPYINYCMIEMCGHEIFRCNVTNFQFSTVYVRDVVAKRAINAIIDASKQFKLARDHIWLWAYLDYPLFKNGPYAPKNYWPVTEDIQSFAICQECVDCCKILVTKKTSKEIRKAESTV